VRLVSDPFGTGDLADSGAALNVIGLQRGANDDAWVGVVTVVESLASHTVNGFQLLDVRSVAHPDATASGFVDTGLSWDDGKVMLMGGANGAGCETADGSTANYRVCHARIYPSGVERINWERYTGFNAATSTVMVVQFGSGWNVQRIDSVTGNTTGGDLNLASQYDSALLAQPVSRDNTWVWGTGHTDTSGLGEELEGVIITLGDGQNEYATEDRISIGARYSVQKNFTVYALEHPHINVSHTFKPYGDDVLVLDVDVLKASCGDRFALGYNSCNGTGTAYPRPAFSARYLDAKTIQLQRRRNGQAFTAWIQGVEMCTCAD
jgi:hypothetical protein